VSTGNLSLAGLYFIRPILSGIGRQLPLKNRSAYGMAVI
jgi:hypothetical protein